MSVKSLIEKYDLENLTIATLASHSSLQIVHGAKKEGFKTALITLHDREHFYRNFENLIDHLIVVNSWNEICTEKVEKKLESLNSIFVPHGSLVEYVGIKCAESFKIPYFGTRKMFRIEADQYKKMSLLYQAGIPIPKEYSLEDDIEKPVIVKLPGAKGGKGYFIATSKKDIKEKLSDLKKSGIIDDEKNVIIQEYVIGTPAYFHYFYSPIKNRIEILGADIRYESNIDGLKRLPSEFGITNFIEPSFVVVGNLPMVLRESLLPKVLDYGERFVKVSKTEAQPGIIGPFSIETIIRDDLEIIAFEFSGRIVAGTNLYISGSPYSWLYFNEEMSMGRRIAREIKMAKENNSLELVLT
ncbi:formate--phosphoribosylaminoimidazolecarboxamide ligase [Fervidicoccus fontis]|uniref:5-formaminoimidazole-4-carboxamide-1-(beta)-D-ribofuranosyl 5'-monophosphate synthetase n=1 Tax=Fervidicoccus fontis TaxID=683846 RepID=A0A7C2ZTG4_9CREN|nr:formate--phosphoribosylaminoimidazolecarboxamide ligase [Fervidicoccus fontis]HEW64031.1 formate--phosphoribosylaminoimidazolecarboxamide ligase [Fervidicoccus fontis]